MTTHNTSADAANTAVRAYLTSLGEKYLGHGFNTGSGAGKKIWSEIKEFFDFSCAYCTQKVEKLTIEHLIPFNRSEGGLHHPGNVVPCCSACNRRDKVDGREVDWRTHLARIVEKGGNNSVSTLRSRQHRIEEHIREYCYPDLSDTETAAICTIAQSLYDDIKHNVQGDIDLFWAIHKSTLGRGS